MGGFMGWMAAEGAFGPAVSASEVGCDPGPVLGAYPFNGVKGRSVFGNDSLTLKASASVAESDDTLGPKWWGTGVTD